MGIGNLMGFGSKPVGGGSLFGLGGGAKFSGGSKPSGVIRKAPLQGTRGQKFRDEARKIGTVRVFKITKEKSGKRNVESVVYKRTGPNKTEDLVADSYYSGQKVSSRERNIREKGGFQSQKDRNVFYKIGGSKLNIGKRRDIEKIFNSKGPTREEVAAELKKQEGFSRRNILGIQLDREKEDDMASRLSGYRKKGAKRSVDMRNLKDNTKINYTNIGVHGIQSTVSAQADKGSLDNSAQTGFANKIEHAEDKQGTAADLSGDKAKGINEPNDTPMFRPGADK